MSRHHSSLTCALLCAILLLASTADAQSFGRNKVRYDSFAFEILETPHFEIYHYSAERTAAIQAGRMAERWYARLSHTLHHTFARRQPIVLYASHVQFTQTNVTPDALGDGIGGFTEHERGRIVLPFAASLGETDHVIGHELVHAFQRDILRASGRSMTLLPLWYLEGMAEYLSVGAIDANTAMWLRDAVNHNRLPRLDQLDDPRWFPYRYGQALWVYLTGRFGGDIVITNLKSKAVGGALGRIMAITGLDAKTLSDGWHASIRANFGGGTRSTSAPALISGASGGGRLNLGPSISPDGRSIVFLSERDRYSIDVFLADAETGTIVRRLLRTAGDPHFDTLEFIESAGAWSPGGRRFALAAVSAGTPVLTILDMPSGEIVREIQLRSLDQVFDPTWSPNGRAIAFSGLKGGFTDLYTVDLDTEELRGLTNDEYADLQPAWSPDGRTLLFTTDRFSSSLSALTFGDFGLASLDVTTSAVRGLPGVPGGKNIDPQWSRDGRRAYFVADGSGTSNVYELSLDTNRIRQLTFEAAGVSGVTALSPSLSIALDLPRLAFSVYKGDEYQIRTVSLELEPLAAQPLVTPTVAIVPAAGGETDRPAPAPTAGARALVTLPVFGVSDGTEFTVKPYRSGLSLERNIQPYVSAGGGGTGRFFRAGVGLSFADMLGDRQLQTLVQGGTSSDDLSLQAAYINMRRRWNWAIVGGHTTWLFDGGTTPVTTAADGTLARESAALRQSHRRTSGLAVYPLNRARRVEVSGGVDWIRFERRTIASTYSPVTGQLLHETSTTLPAAQDAWAFDSGVALVEDAAVQGATAPVLGSRSRLAINPTLGSIPFTTVTADYRRYIMPVRSLTVAMRVMHVGRFGAGTGDARLVPLIWTIRDLVRGYGDFGPSDDTLGYLDAARMTVGNVELRVPLSAIAQAPQPLPMDVFAFADGGVFGRPNRQQQIDDDALVSAGAGVRINAAGIALELAAARPFHAGTRGWTVAFNVKPGF